MLGDNYKAWEINPEDFYGLKTNKEKLTFLLKYAVLAPSGDNSQPWRFEVSENEIKVFNIPERDRSLYNFNQSATLMAQGALAENIIVSLKGFGYQTEFIFWEPMDDNDPVFSVKIGVLNESERDGLFLSIGKRKTNRKRYEKRSINKTEASDIINSSKEIGWGEVKLIDDKTKINQLSNLLSFNEELVLSTRELHNFLFEHVTWTDKEQEQKRTGMDIKTLELKGPEKIAFRLLKRWQIAKVLNFLGISKIVGHSSANNFRHSGAIGAIICNKDSKKDILMAGRLLERIWLNTTKRKMSMQLLTGIFFFRRRIINGLVSPFTKKQADKILDYCKRVEDIFGVEDEKNVIICFRVGYDGEPSGRCLRLEPEIKYNI